MKTDINSKASLRPDGYTTSVLVSAGPSFVCLPFSVSGDVDVSPVAGRSRLSDCPVTDSCGRSPSFFLDIATTRAGVLAVQRDRQTRDVNSDRASRKRTLPLLSSLFPILYIEPELHRQLKNGADNGRGTELGTLTAEMSTSGRRVEWPGSEKVGYALHLRQIGFRRTCGGSPPKNRPNTI